MNTFNKYCFFCILIFTLFGCTTTPKNIWQIGKFDHSAAEFALGPKDFKKFLENDFGYEDRFFLVEHSNSKKDFPYVLPGPADTWGGTWLYSGWRTHEVNILFGLEKVTPDETFELTVQLLDFAKKHPPLVKISVNEQDEKIQLTAPGYDLASQPSPRYTEAVADTLSITGDLSTATPHSIKITVAPGVLKQGGNCITITILEGSWMMFDAIRLDGRKVGKLTRPNDFFIRNVQAADYELMEDNAAMQPSIVDVQWLQGNPELGVVLDGKKIFQERVESGRYQFEALMPAIKQEKKSSFKITENGKTVFSGAVIRKPKKTQTLADYIDTRIGTVHSRWMIAPGPWMPFSMVKLSPDNQNAGWQAGYQPTFESVGCFSHTHEWTVGGLGIMAANGELKTQTGDERQPESGYRSRIDKRSEEAKIGYYKAYLTDYDILAEITATIRAGFLKFTFPDDSKEARIMVDQHPPAEYDFQLLQVEVRKINDYRIEGFSRQFVPNVWNTNAVQDYVVNFVIEFDAPIQRMGGWVDNDIQYADVLTAGKCIDAGVFLEFDPAAHPVVQIRTGISPVSVENAAMNLQTELINPFGWNFDAVRQNQIDVWNNLFDRVRITTSNRMEKSRFYNNMYRALCSRNIWSDVNGEWISTDKVIRKTDHPENVMLSCDAFWNTFWNLNQFWNLITPEWSSKWVKSQLSMYKANRWLAKGPAALNYVPVMVAEHEIPLMVSAYQMGIRDYDIDLMYEAVKKMQTTPAQKVFNGFAGNRDWVPYLKYKYVPSDLGRFSNTMEYSFDDWTVGQLAKALEKEDDYRMFNERGYWWKNTISPEGYCHLRTSNGEWAANFDPFKSGANQHYVEGNAWQLTFLFRRMSPN